MIVGKTVPDYEPLVLVTVYSIHVMYTVYMYNHTKAYY